MYEKWDAFVTIVGLASVLYGIFAKDIWIIISGTMLVSVGYPGTYLVKRLRLRTSDETQELE